MKYKRIVLKLSGEALTGSKHSNIDPAVLEQYSAEIKAVKEKGGKEIAIVIGGGNIFRGGQAEADQPDQAVRREQTRGHLTSVRYLLRRDYGLVTPGAEVEPNG